MSETVKSPPSATELASRMRPTVTRLARRLRQQVDSPITPSQLAVLGTVEKHGPLTLGDLAAHERVQPPSMTRIAASLEENGLVARAVDPSDKRVSRVSITTDGKRLLDRSRSRKTAYLAARLNTFSAGEREILDRAMALVDRMLEEDR